MRKKLQIGLWNVAILLLVTGCYGGLTTGASSSVDMATPAADLETSGSPADMAVGSSLDLSVPAASCGDHICQSGETCSSCAIDCGACSTAGNPLPADRRVDWSQAGVPGGIPNRTTICATLGVAGQSSSYVQGVTSAQINSAIMNCPANQVVYLNAGTYSLSSGIRINKSYVTVRGAGANQTILKFVGISDMDLVLIGMAEYGTLPPNYLHLSVADFAPGNYPKGTTQITLTSAFPASEVGGIVCFDQLYDNVHVFQLGTQSGAAWDTRDGVADNGATADRVLQQCVIVTQVSADGKTLTTSTGLASPYWNNTQKPQAWWWGKADTVFSSGLENVAIQYVDSGCNDTALVGTYASWVKGVNMSGSGCTGNGYGVMLRFSKNAEIRDNFIHDTAYGAIEAGFHAVSDTLIENNIISKPDGAAIYNSGASGTVLGYNYFSGPEASIYVDPNSTWLTESMVTHGGHPHFFLIEGNEFPDVYFDGYHGSAGHLNVFRNRLKGNDDNPNHTADICTVCIAPEQEYVSVIGNVLGWPASGFQTEYSPDSSNGIYMLDAFTIPTLLRGGNFDTATKTVVWKDNLTTLQSQGKVPSSDTAASYLPSQSLPPSLYRTSKPSWFGSSPWPPIGPDVTGGDAAVSGHAYDIPAKRCFMSENLANSPVAFNASACYGN